MCVCNIVIHIHTVRRQDHDVNYFHMPPVSMTEFSPVTTPRLVVGKLVCVYNLTFQVGGYTEMNACAIREICEICKPFTIVVLWVISLILWLFQDRLRTQD